MKRLALAGAVLLALLGTGCSEDDASPEAVAGQMLWTDVGGRTQLASDVVSEFGPEHCEWQTATFLYLGGTVGRAPAQYLRDPDRVVPGRLATTFAASVVLPSDARDTGFRQDGVALWVTGDAAYLVRNDVTERWPRTVDGIGCA